jgi:carbonic anhydrase/acetyltransferase-like protein (isoleucine patch superfamily)
MKAMFKETTLMYRYYIEDENHVPPFNQPASELTIGDRPLKIHQEELFAGYAGEKLELKGVFKDSNQLIEVKGESVVYRNNLWFDEDFLAYFMQHAQKSKKASRAAFRADDLAFKTYTLPLAHDLESDLADDGTTIYLLDLWYFPNDYTRDVEPIVIPSDAREIGFFAVPGYMTMQQGDLTHYAPMRAVVSVESWVHIYFASIIFGTFARSGRLDKTIEESFFKSLRLLWRAIIEQRQILSASGAVEMGTGCSIDPSAIIRGPAKIGNNVTIGAGAIIDNCTIGNNVNIDAGCMLFQSTVGDGCFLPFRAALYLTAVMEDVIIAQNTCLQMCVIGRNTFVGAGSTFTDFNMFGNIPIKCANRYGELEEVGQVVIGGAVGHNCRIGAGMVVMPGRMIESDVVLVASPQRRVINRNVTYEESDHHSYGSQLHRRFFPQHGEVVVDSEMSSW